MRAVAYVHVVQQQLAVRYVFEEHGAHPVRQLLQFAEERGGAAHDEEGDDRDDGEHRQKDQPHDPIFQKCEDAVSESVR